MRHCSRQRVSSCLTTGGLESGHGKPHARPSTTSGLMKILQCLLTDDALPGILAIGSLVQASAMRKDTCKVAAGVAIVYWVQTSHPLLQESASGKGIKSILKPAAAGTEARASSRHKQCRVRIQEN